MKLIIYTITIALLLLIADPLMAQEETIHGFRGKKDGYSQTYGDTTYHYNVNGKETGYSRTVGDQTIEYGPGGKVKGYSQNRDGKQYYYNNRGKQVGYATDPKENVADDTPVEANSVGQSAFDWGTSNSTWGFSGDVAGKDEQVQK